MNHENVLDRLVVRPVRHEELSRWNAFMQQHHYLGLKWLGGKSLRYIAQLEGEWVALIGWSSAAKNCGARERYIGWSGEKKYRRLRFIANNSRFLILPWVSQKNLASKILSLNLKRICSDFELVYGHPIYLAETFVDESRFKGTCYKAANWKHVGYSEGYSRSSQRYYHHGQVKAVYIYNLCKRANEILSGDLIPYDVSLLKDRRRLETMIKFPIDSLLKRVEEFTDPRSKQGRRHPLATVLSIAVCAVLSGCRCYRAIGDWSNSLSSEELIRFGSNRGTPPSEPTIRRLIKRIDADKFDRHMGQWLLEQKLLEMPNGLKGCGIAIDGKTLRGSHNGSRSPKGIHLLSAVIHKEGIVFAQEEVDEKTNEIKHVKPLFKNIDIEGAIVTADALHTQTETAKYLVEEKKADFLFTVKENQPTLLGDIKYLDLKKTPNPGRITKPPIKDMGV
ncbi:MAG: ISAs1 family transposase [Candidatus Aminicenantes bacterium]|nr:ISAs1 family transposase [Candidatus Aminicenantes bacterium]